MKKVRATLVIDQLHSIVDQLIDLIPTLENQHTQYKIEQLIKIDTNLVKELENRHGEFHFKNLVNSMKKVNVRKSIFHAQKLKHSICYVRDDFPPQKDQEVSIKRYEHGWLDGAWSGKIKEVHGISNSKKSYTVTITEQYGEPCDPFELYVNHTRDLYY